MGLGISMRYGNVKVGSLHETRPPHPERCTEAVLGNDDGKLIFMSMIEALKKAKVGV
jgi:phosphoribosylformylglycinamidine (FGAM) synthase-like amidotransferase family enzyme